MEPAHKALLRKHLLELSGQLQVSDTIVPFLYQEDILTQAQVEQVLAQPAESQRSLKLLQLLPARGPRAFPALLRALDDYSWVRDRLLLELQDSPGPTPGTTPGTTAGTTPGTTAGTTPGTTDPWRPPASVLTRVPSDRELSRLASRLGAEAEPVLLDLGLSAEAWFRCRSDNSLSAHGATLAALLLWRRAEGKKASVQRLLQSLEAAGVHPSVLQEVLV